MQQYKKWVITFLLLNAFIFASITALIYLVDPLQQFRPVKSYQPVYSYDIRLQIPGIIKNYDYDSLMIGSSTSQNTMISQINSLFNCNCIKLTLPGASAREMSQLFQEAAKYQDIKTVIMGVDFFPYAGEPDRLRRDYPDYLYNFNITNFYKYFYDGYIVKKVLTKTKWNTFFDDKKHKFDMDIFCYNGHKKTPSKIKVIQTFFNSNYTSSDSSETYLQEARLSFKENFIDNAIKHPNTEFRLFFTPISILDWVRNDNQGNLDAFLEFRKFIAEKCDNLPNVKLYDFQWEVKITHTLENYYDITHYGEEINRYIIDNLNDSKYQVDLEKCRLNNQMIQQQVKDYKENQIKIINKEYLDL